MGSSVDEALDFLSEKLFPLAEAYSRIRLALMQRMEARAKSRTGQESKDEAAKISYRDFLFDSMVQATTKRLALNFSKSYQGTSSTSLAKEVFFCLFV